MSMGSVEFRNCYSLFPVQSFNEDRIMANELEHNSKPGLPAVTQFLFIKPPLNHIHTPVHFKYTHTHTLGLLSLIKITLVHPIIAQQALSKSTDCHLADSVCVCVFHINKVLYFLE